MAIALGALAVPAAAADGPGLSVPEQQMRSALHCTGDLASSPRAPVLLVHGTASSGAESWGWTYMRGLPLDGHSACTIDLPARAMDDIQRSAEYVVGAVRYMSSVAGRRIDVVGHSQGGVEPLWALKWWPDLRDRVDDYVGIGTGGHGLAYLDALCRPGTLCPPAFWQLRASSRFLAALRAGGMTPAPVSYTSVISATDEVATPEVGPDPVGVIPGATNVYVQDLCPGRVVDHIAEVYDAAAYAIVLDALDHPGTARLARIERGVCSRLVMPGVDRRSMAAELAVAGAGLARGAVGAREVREEPAPAAYVR